MNLRGKFRTDDQGRYKFVGIRPVPYPIPDDGPVGEMLRASGRNWYRAAHIHLIVSAAGYVPVTTHLFVKGDSVPGVGCRLWGKDLLIADFVRHDGLMRLLDIMSCAVLYGQHDGWSQSHSTPDFCVGSTPVACAAGGKGRPRVLGVTSIAADSKG